MLLSSLSWPVVARGSVAVLVLLLGLLVLGGIVRRVHRRRGFSAEERRELDHLPLTPLQRRAWWGLGIGLVLGGGAGLLLLRKGAEAFFEDDGLRVLVIGVVAAVGVTELLLLRLPRLRHGEGRMVLDERDRQVLLRAPVVQSRIVLLSLVAWSIALTEAYSDEGAIPIGYPYLILMTTLILDVVSYSAGILLGYWAVRHDAQG